MRCEQRIDLVGNKFTDLFPTFLYMCLSNEEINKKKCDILDAFVLKLNGADGGTVEQREAAEAAAALSCDAPSHSGVVRVCVEVEVEVEVCGVADKHTSTEPTFSHKETQQD